MQEPDDEESVTVAEAARRLGCGASTVRALIASGELTGHRVGKCSQPRGIRVHAAAVRRYKARHALGPAPGIANDTPSEPPRRNSVVMETRRRLRQLGILD